MLNIKFAIRQLLWTHLIMLTQFIFLQCRMQKISNEIQVCVFDKHILIRFSLKFRPI